MKKFLLSFFAVASTFAAVAQQTVTFSVGIPSTTTGFTAIDVTGNWVAAAGLGSDWGDALTLTDGDGDGVYTGTAVLPDGSYEAKFRVQSAGGTNWEGVPGACATNGNRGFTVAGGPAAVGPYCFGTCDVTCPNFVPVTVNFSVDLNGGPTAADIPVDAVNGSGSPVVYGINMTGNLGGDAGFSDWTPGSIALTDADGDGIYTVTLNLLSKNYEYKFLFGSWWNWTDALGTVFEFAEQGALFANGDFTCLSNTTNPDNFTNRVLSLSGQAANSTVDVSFVWQSCATISGLNTAGLDLGMAVSPNPFSQSAIISFSNDNAAEYTFTLTSLTGQVVRQQMNVRGNQVVLERNGLSTGMYFATLTNAQGAASTIKVVVE